MILQSFPTDGVPIWPVYEWVEMEMLQIPIEFGQGMIPVALFPVPLSQMEKYIYYAIVEKFTASIQKLENPN